MLIKILLGVVVAIAIFLIYVSTKPNSFRYERSTVIAAPAAVVFAQVNDFHKWQAWNPWGKLDPATKETFSGAESGLGAGYAWAGNGNVGEGRMTIMESRPNEFIQIKLEFVKPFAATNTAEFTFVPQGDQTKATWASLKRDWPI
jgi:uncharacterized protein YndB with AHSA1/START domain